MSHVRRKDLLQSSLFRINLLLLIYNLTLSNLCPLWNITIRCAQSRRSYIIHLIVLSKGWYAWSFNVEWVSDKRSPRTWFFLETSLPLLVTLIRRQCETLVDERFILSLWVCTDLVSVATKWYFLRLTPTIVSWVICCSWPSNWVTLLRTSWDLVVCGSPYISFALCLLVLIITLTRKVFT